MSRHFDIPASVMRNAEERLAVAQRFRTRTCVYDSCDLPATHWPATGSPACETHRSRPPVPVPDPLRSEAHLRRTFGSLSSRTQTGNPSTEEVA